MLKKSIVFALSFSALYSITAIAQDQELSVKYNHFYDFYQKRAAELVQSMSLEEKIGQMTLVNMAAIKKESLPGNWDAIEKYNIGAILADGDEMPETKSPNLSDWQIQMKSINSHTALVKKNGTHIPLLLGTDAVHGNQHVANAVIFPHNIGLGATHDPELIKQIAAWTAYDVKQSGFNWAYAATVAIAHNYRWGRTYESFSSDPDWASQFAQKYVLGAQNIDDESHQLRGVLSSTKHFIGDGNTDNGTDEGNVTVIDVVKFTKENKAGYEGAFSAGTGNVMVSYSSITDMSQNLDTMPMSVNEKYLKKYLFTEDDSLPRFNGFTVSDYTAISKAATTRKQTLAFHQTLAEAVNAGLDMIMVSKDDISMISNDSALSDHSDNISAFQAALLFDCNQGLITPERIDEAVTHILQVKLAMGLFDSSKTALAPPEGDENKVALQAAEESLVLLKNDASVIPADRRAIKHVILLANNDTLVNDIGTQCGGWRIKWQGLAGNDYTDFHASSILTGINHIAGDMVTINSDKSDTNNTNNTIVIAVIAEPPYAEMFGDRTDLTMNFDSKTLERIKAFKEAKIPVITILISGRPMIVSLSDDAPLKMSDAFIAAWLPGTTGGDAIANAIFGNYHFGYKEGVNTLSFPWPENMEQVNTGRLVCPSIRNTGDPKPLDNYDCGYGLRT